MHVIAINLPDLLISLWRGTIDCDRDDCQLRWDWVVLTGEVWKAHGADIARCRPYFPGSFDVPPRTPQRRSQVGTKPGSFYYMSSGSVQHCYVICFLSVTGQTSLN